MLTVTLRSIQPLVVVLTCCLCVAPSRGADPQYAWQVGLASDNITPTEPVRMAGYRSKQREQLSRGVASELFARAMAIEDDQGNRALLITADLIGVTAAISDPIYRRIKEATGLAREQILINCSHTHTGPRVGLDAETLAHLKDEDHIQRTTRYTKRVSDQIVQLSKQAIESLSPARLSWGIGVAPFVMNRREFTDRGVRLGVNPRGLADRSVVVVKIADQSGRVRGLIVGACCHNTTLGGDAMQISGDFAGYAQKHVARKLGVDVPVMFMQGCAGDANPYPRGTEELARVHGMTLGEEALRVADTDLVPLGGPLTCHLADVELPLKQEFSDQDYANLERSSGATREIARQLKEKIAAGEKLATSYRSQIGLWQFGDSCTLVALPGEVVVDYVRLIEERIGPRKLWVTAYNHDVFGYLPSARVLREGGYETRGIYSGGFGVFSPQAEKVVVENVAELSMQSGRMSD